MFPRDVNTFVGAARLTSAVLVRRTGRVIPSGVHSRAQESRAGQCRACNLRVSHLSSIEDHNMPDPKTIERARRDRREGKSPSTQAGEFVREEMHHIREGKHGAVSAKQAIAIGLSKARRSGVKLPATGSASTRKKAQQDTQASRSKRKPSATRSRANSKALKR